MAKIFLERFAVKRIEKRTVQVRSLTVIGVNSMITASNWASDNYGEGGPLIPVAAPSVGWVFAKTTGDTCF